MSIDVLVVEDEPQVCMVDKLFLKEFFRSNGISEYSISFADNGSDALSLIRDKGGDLDLVLLDVSLSEDYSGHDVFEFIKGEFSELSSKVLFVTGNSTGFYDSFGSSYAPCLEKPFSPDKFFASISRYLL